ncbi:hypothetical protein DL95DRAFT_397994, partial [Leptodontidium sp. 2 PMI_412]
MASTWPKNVDPSLWRDAEDIVRTSNNLNEIESVCKFLLIPEDAAMMLYERSGSILHGLCRGKGIHKSKHRKAKAKEIVETIRGSSVSGQTWDGNWIIPAILSADKEIEWIAKELDTQIHSALCMFSFSDLVSFSIARNSSISVFFDAMSNLFNELAQNVGVDGVPANLLLLQKEVQHPLSRWIVSSTIESVTSPFSRPEPSDALQFLLDPIRKVFENQPSVPQVLEELRILEARFKLRINNRRTLDRRTLDDTPLSIDLTLWDSIRVGRLDHLARSHTDCVVSLFSTLSVGDVLQNLRGVKDISKNWVDLSDDISVCLTLDRKLTGEFMKLAKHFLDLKNVHSATAVGMALWISDFRCPPQWSTDWGVINPEGNFAGCRSFMDENHCLPCLMAYTADLRSSLSQIFRFAEYIGRYPINEQNVARRGKGFGEGVEQKIGHEEKYIWEETSRWADLWEWFSIWHCI